MCGEEIKGVEKRPGVAKVGRGVEKKPGVAKVVRDVLCSRLQKSVRGKDCLIVSTKNCDAPCLT